jgi:hypothetical protein
MRLRLSRLLSSALLLVSVLSLRLSAQAPPPAPAAPPSAAAQPAQEPEGWAALEPGQGFQVAKTERGDLWISAYGLFRYLNQLPADQTFVDHLGRERVIDTRNDVQWHRVQAFLKGLGLQPAPALHREFLDGQRDGAGRDRRHAAVPGEPGDQSGVRRQRHAGNALARRLPSVLAGTRPGHGGRVLPPGIHVGGVDRRTGHSAFVLQLHGRHEPESRAMLSKNYSKRSARMLSVWLRSCSQPVRRLVR